ncbi:MAG: pyridoxamine 5'-phosphate oxidase family protein [Pseudomonadota bacterium]
MRDGPPGSLEAVEEACLSALTRAVHDKRSPLKWPVMATSSGAGGADARIVVLRGFDRAARRAEVWSDRRSQKVSDLTANPDAALLFFDRSKMVQIRARGRAQLLSSGAHWEAAFARASNAKLDDYTTQAAPGAALTGDEVVHDERLAAANFTVIQISVETADWLQLSREGHRRALLDWRNGAAHSWRVP